MVKKRAPKKVSKTRKAKAVIAPAAPQFVAPKQLALPAPRRGWLQKHISRKLIAVPSAILLILLVLTAIPATRYTLPSVVTHKSLSLILLDSQTQSRVQDADVSIGGKSYTSDSTGVVWVYGLKPGPQNIIITKPFYKDFAVKVNVPLLTAARQQTFTIDPIGRISKVTVKNRLSGRLLVGALIKTEQGSQGKTGSDGTATLVLPSDQSQVSATVSGDGILTTTVTVQAVQDATTNLYQVMPAGKIYFLSKTSSQVDLVKTNLDGTSRQTVLAGTGREDPTDTILTASADWKFLALKSRRDSDFAKLYLIETTSDTVTTMDDSAATFTMDGWSGEAFMYSVVHDEIPVSTVGRQTLKSYNGATKKSVTLDTSQAVTTGPAQSKKAGYGAATFNEYAAELIQNVYILQDQIIYVKTWSASYYYGTLLGDKKMVVASVQPDGSGKKVLHDWPAGYNAYMHSTRGGLDQLYFDVELDGVRKSYWTYKDGQVTQSTAVTSDDFTKVAPVYLRSPNGQSTLWNQSNDGRNALFVGNQQAQGASQIATLTDFAPFGWYSDDYVVVSRDNNELFTMGRDGIKPGAVPSKVSDYLKNSSF